MSLSNPQFLMWYLLPTSGYYNPWYDSSTLRLRPRDAPWSLCRTEVSVFMEITPCGHLCRQRSNPGETVFTTSAVVSWFLEKNLLLFHLAASTANTFPQFASGSDGNVWGCRMWTLSLSFLCLTCFGTGQFLQMPEFRVEIRVSFLLTEISSACFYSYIFQRHSMFKALISPRVCFTGLSSTFPFYPTAEITHFFLGSIPLFFGNYLIISSFQPL